MNYKLILKTVGVVAVSGFLLVGCGGGSRPSKSTGQWICIDDKGEGCDGTDMELFSDGSGVGKKDEISIGCTWKIVDKRLIISASAMGTDVREAHNYKVSGYELTLTGNDGKVEKFAKKESAKA